jgi:hypothetical protein
MDELILHRTELLVLLDALETAQLVGIDSDEIIPKDIDAHRALVQQGHARLQSRGGLSVDASGVLSLASDLAQLAGVIAFPSTASIIVRDTPGLGRQTFIHCAKGPNVIEHTRPDEESHRFAMLPGQDGLFARWRELLPVANGGSQATFDLSVDAFMTMKEAAERGDIEQATGVLSAAGVSATDAAQLIQAIREPDFSASLALVKCQEQRVIDGRNPLVLTSVSSAWMILPDATDPGLAHIRGVNRDTLTQALAAMWSELAQR